MAVKWRSEWDGPFQGKYNQKKCKGTGVCMTKSVHGLCLDFSNSRMGLGADAEETFDAQNWSGFTFTITTDREQIPLYPYQTLGRFLTPEWGGVQKRPVMYKSVLIRLYFYNNYWLRARSHSVHIKPLGGSWKTTSTVAPSSWFPMNRLLAFGEGEGRAWVWKMQMLPVSNKENPDFQMSHWDVIQKASHYFNSDVFSEYPLVICFRKKKNWKDDVVGNVICLLCRSEIEVLFVWNVTTITLEIHSINVTNTLCSHPPSYQLEEAAKTDSGFLILHLFFSC